MQGLAPCRTGCHLHHSRCSGLLGTQQSPGVTPTDWQENSQGQHSRLPDGRAPEVSNGGICQGDCVNPIFMFCLFYDALTSWGLGEGWSLSTNSRDSKQLAWGSRAHPSPAGTSFLTPSQTKWTVPGPKSPRGQIVETRDRPTGQSLPKLSKPFNPKFTQCTRQASPTPSRKSRVVGLALRLPCSSLPWWFPRWPLLWPALSSWGLWLSPCLSPYPS